MVGLRPSKGGRVTDGPLDRPVRQDPAAGGRPPSGRPRPARPSPRSPNSNAPPSTCTPTGSPRWRCGTRAPPGTTPSRWSTRSSASPASRSRSRCWSTSSTPWAATAGCSCKNPGARPVLVAPGPRGARGGAAAQEDRPDARRPDRRRHRRRAPVRARAPQAGAAQDRLAGRGPGRATSTARRTPSSWPRGRLDAARLPARGGRGRSGPAGPAWSCCPAAPARRWSARPRWPRPRPPR